MAGIVDTFKEEQFRLFNGNVSVPIFKAPQNHSSYYDSTVDAQIVISLPDNDGKSIAPSPKNT